MKPTDVIVLLASMTLMVLVFTNVQPATARSLDSFMDNLDNERLADWLLRHIADYRRERRTQMDAGFLSRHSALKNFLNSYDASIEASDPHGPGRRK